jgi:DNA-binding beta-propeller fold protein YncE
MRLVCVLGVVLFFSVWVYGRSLEPLKSIGVVRLLHVEGRLDQMAADVDGHRVFLSALTNNSVQVIDVKRKTVLYAIAGLAQPKGIGYLAGFDRIYVANGGDGTVRKYDGGTYLPLQNKKIGDNIENLHTGISDNRVFVGYGRGTLVGLDDTEKKLFEIKLDAHPEGFKLEGFGPRIFVNVPDRREVEVLDRDTHAIIAKWPLKGERRNFAMALDEGSRRLFVACRQPSTLVVMDMSTGAVIQKLPTIGDSDDVSYDRERKRIYVTGGEGAISVYEQKDPDHYRQIARVPTASGARTSLFVADWGQLFVAVPARGNRGAELRIYSVQP